MQNRPFSPEVIFSSIPALLPYLLVTLEVGLISILTGSILGMLLAWAKLSSHKVLRCAADGYTYVIRCTPSIVLLFIVFYGLPKWMEFWKFCDQSFERKRAGIHDRTHRSFGKDESDHCQKLWRIWDRALHGEHDPILGAVDRD